MSNRSLRFQYDQAAHRVTRQSMALAAMLFLFAGAAWAAHAEKEIAPRFEPVRVVHMVEPIYPFTSVGIGTVILCVRINESGAVAGMDVIHDIPSLTEEAQRVVRLWKFQPAKLDGKPVDGSIIVAFAFSNATFTGPWWVAGPRKDRPAQFKPIQIISTVGAVYPEKNRGSGTVTLEVKVDQSGAIDTLTVIPGIPSLTEAAALTETVERTVRKWDFRPATVDGQPVISVMVASFTFRVPGSGR